MIRSGHFRYGIIKNPKEPQIVTCATIEASVVIVIEMKRKKIHDHPKNRDHLCIGGVV